MRIGFGYDVHRLVEGRALIVGGVEIPFPLGLLGHSDGDVLAHAICDALLGAIGEGDIGRHFPDCDPRYKGIRSTLLLESVARLVKEKGFIIGNIDTTIVAERPRFAPFIPRMVGTLAEALNVDPDRVSVKAKTEEGLGFTGRGEGIAAHAVALVLPAPREKDPMELGY